MRAASTFRLIAAAALLVALVALFYEPLRIVLGPKFRPAVQSLGLSGLFQGQAASGFMLQISSQPSGATVSIDGAARGMTPALLNVVCEDGEDVTLTVFKEGFPEYRRTVPCRAGQTAQARIDLQR